jgi:hypothetical protein
MKLEYFSKNLTEDVIMFTVKKSAGQNNPPDLMRVDRQKKNKQ